MYEKKLPHTLYVIVTRLPAYILRVVYLMDVVPREAMMIVGGRTPHFWREVTMIGYVCNLVG